MLNSRVHEVLVCKIAKLRTFIDRLIVGLLIVVLHLTQLIEILNTYVQMVLPCRHHVLPSPYTFLFDLVEIL
jgi:hypothetical protein